VKTVGRLGRKHVDRRHVLRRRENPH
jgi:hypothetical protein